MNKCLQHLAGVRPRHEKLAILRTGVSRSASSVPLSSHATDRP
jgi:hypothetical protein